MKIEINPVYDKSAGMWKYYLYVNGEFVHDIKGVSDVRNKVNNLINAWFL